MKIPRSSLFLLLLFPVVLMAASESAPGGSGSIGELEALRSEIAVLKARVEVADERSKLASKGAADSSSLPRVSSVYGSNGRMFASLLMSDGAALVVSKGDHISGYEVSDISVDSVVVKSPSGGHSKLSFSSSFSSIGAQGGAFPSGAASPGSASIPSFPIK